ncbi:MAG: DUF2249 domain-containing protein [Hydrogenophaga sp.]|nr:DUF2249 domain-containing protein [Hydrogenophaga sp.]
MTLTLLTDFPLLGVRTIAPPQRHPLIFGRFDALAPGESFEIVNDHDPLPLYVQFERSRLGQFDWHYLQQGPALWQGRIGRVLPSAAAHAHGEEIGGGCGHGQCPN